ncbi:MAG: DUF4115 domain-containing protein [Woeseiaceae bacterium]|nr:DUF4115 domain-containing protein [Woeseiaceae bacterium]
MSETDEQRGEATETETPGGPVAGERLAKARRDQQVSVLEVAKELHLDEAKVRALERNEFDVLGAPVFAKGHLRKYAELVGIDVDDVLTDYYKLTRAERMPPLIVGRSRAKNELSPGPWIVVIIILIALAAAYWWFVEREVPAAAPAAQSPVPATTAGAEPGRDVAAPDAAPQEPARQTAAPAAAEPAVSTPEPAVQAARTRTAADSPAEPATPATTAEPAPPAATAEPAPPDVRLTVSFDGDCWTEISDGEGRRMYFGMGRAGQTVDLVGVAPVSALFGNAANVTLFVDGADYALPVTAPNQPVRLTLTGSR